MIIRFFWIFISLCALSSINTAAQDRYADSLFRAGDYRLAALEYERLISQSSDVNIVNSWRYQRALSFKYLGEYGRAQVELSKVSYWSLTDSMNTVFRYEAALCDYLAGNFANVVFQTDQMTSKSATKAVKANISLLRVLSFNELMQWENARTEALAYNRMMHNGALADSIETVLTNAYTHKNLPRIKSQKKANVLRMLPGLGQAYAGSPLEGSFNFILNLAFLSFGAYQIYQGYFITGYFVGAIGLNKVYFGGHARTAFLLEKHNYKVKKRFCENIKTILLK